MKRFWICGQIKETTWDFQGVFDSEEKAILACKNENFFVAPIKINEELFEGSEKWPGLYFPKKVKK